MIGYGIKIDAILKYPHKIELNLAEMPKGTLKYPITLKFGI